MNEFNPLMLFTKLSGFSVLLRAHRSGCTTTVAVKVHDNLGARIEEVKALLSAAIRNGNDPESAWYYQNQFDEIWSMGRADDAEIPLLDELIVDRFTREYHIGGTATWHAMDCGMPEKSYVGDSDLCGLAAVMDQIAAETGIRFAAYRVLYDGDDAGGNPEHHPLYGPDTD